jgi:hypothetical protein
MLLDHEQQTEQISCISLTLSVRVEYIYSAAYQATSPGAL